MSVSLTDLMKELQAGEEARAKVPQLQTANDELARRLDSAQFHNGTLEGNIIGYKQQIDALSAKVRSLEVERDDAGFRALEADDKANRLLQATRVHMANLMEDVAAIDPPKPEPIPQPVVQDAPVSVTETPTIHQQPETPTIVAPASSTNIPITDHGVESVAGPTVPAMDTTLQSASSGTAAESPGVSSEKSSTSDTTYRPFEGDAAGKSVPPLDFPEEKRWYNKPAGMSSANWIASGGQA